MKNKYMLMIIILMVGFISGCNAPSNWNIEEEDWELWETGEIIEFGIERSIICDRSPVCYIGCLKHGSYRFITFKKGKTIQLRKIRNPEKIKVGSYGKLYKYNTTSNNKKAWFQWIPEKIIEEKINPVDNFYVAKKVVELEKAIIVVSKIKKPIIKEKYEWKRAALSKSKIYETVLLKLEDGIITTGYLNNKEEWKLEFYKNKINGGMPLSNVVEWKEIDLN